MTEKKNTAYLKCFFLYGREEHSYTNYETTLSNTDASVHKSVLSTLGCSRKPHLTYHIRHHHTSLLYKSDDIRRGYYLPLV